VSLDTTFLLAELRPPERRQTEWYLILKHMQIFWDCKVTKSSPFTLKSACKKLYFNDFKE